MHIWPFQVDGDGLTRAGAGLVFLAFCFILRAVAILVYAARSHDMLRFPPRRAVRLPRMLRRGGRKPAPEGAARRPLRAVDRVALWGGIAVGAVVLVLVFFALTLFCLVAGFVALGAVGWYLGPVAAVAVWLLACSVSVVWPLRRSRDRAAALGRLYRSARLALTGPVMIGSLPVFVPSPLWPLVRWADNRVRPRVDISSGPAPWVEDVGPGLRVRGRPAT